MGNQDTSSVMYQGESSGGSAATWILPLTSEGTRLGSSGA